MNALPKTREALGESWTKTRRHARRIARHGRDAAEDIGGEMHSLMSAIEEAMADGTQADVAQLRGQLRKLLDTTYTRLNDTRKATRERVEVTLSDADDYVRENPWQAIAIVGGIALVAGALLARSRD
ncbi:DUF883 family protein [Paraburkholderia bonniea]|uniref:DUF883 family protein n=1 Tax=Paraburkholderia bonniea TaxID=2152891 RepID=UPI0012911842|nr:DUF883 family protein [Paraburkholderia bonniea]WJF90588.1 DUF883 family protein [Paraburkholderia bonniea]WJF93903.1 DUF883 family protein [Paraburkholderia bonniea]